MIECRNVYKFLGKKQVLQDVNLEIQDGTIFGLIGPNGAGKSTLLRMLAGIYQCDGGQIVLDNERIFDHPDSKRQILFISDEPFQFSCVIKGYERILSGLVSGRRAFISSLFRAVSSR